ncbi:hypothetical protein C0J52_02114 [Blattella germanica]|nr:hypothetical protein C0J52_02114 [Blattella germanica]
MKIQNTSANSKTKYGYPENSSQSYKREADENIKPIQDIVACETEADNVEPIQDSASYETKAVDNIETNEDSVSEKNNIMANEPPSVHNNPQQGAQSYKTDTHFYDSMPALEMIPTVSNNMDYDYQQAYKTIPAKTLCTKKPFNLSLTEQTKLQNVSASARSHGCPQEGREAYRTAAFNDVGTEAPVNLSLVEMKAARATTTHNHFDYLHYNLPPYRLGHFSTSEWRNKRENVFHYDYSRQYYRASAIADKVHLFNADTPYNATQRGLAGHHYNYSRQGGESYEADSSTDIEEPKKRIRTMITTEIISEYGRTRGQNYNHSPQFYNTQAEYNNVHVPEQPASSKDTNPVENNSYSVHQLDEHHYGMQQQLDEQFYRTNILQSSCGYHYSKDTLTRK